MKFQRFSAVACQTTNPEMNSNVSCSTQEAGSQTVYLRSSNVIENLNNNQFNLSSSTSPLNFDSLYSSQETQTIFQNFDANGASLATQEAGSQTIFTSNAHLYNASLLAPPPLPPPPPPSSPIPSSNTQTTSTSTHFQTDDFCLDAATSTYLDMYLSDISTQTQLTSPCVQFDLEQNLSESFYYLNEHSNQQNDLQIKPFKESETNNNHHLTYNDRESMTTPPTSSIFSNSTCQTDSYFIENSNYTNNSTQTHARTNSSFNCKTQTEWTH